MSAEPIRRPPLNVPLGGQSQGWTAAATSARRPAADGGDPSDSERGASASLERLRLGSALRACQVASSRCDRAIPQLSTLDDGRVHALTDCLELSELCAQALGRALEGSASPFLEDELALCAKVARNCADAVGGDPEHELCAEACRTCAEWCERVLAAGIAARRSDGRSAA